MIRKHSQMWIIIIQSVTNFMLTFLKLNAVRAAWFAHVCYCHKNKDYFRRDAFQLSLIKPQCCRTAALSTLKTVHRGLSCCPSPSLTMIQHKIQHLLSTFSMSVSSCNFDFFFFKPAESLTLHYNDPWL